MTLHAHLSPSWREATSDGRSPVVLLLHGYGSNEDDLASLAPDLPGVLAWASLRAPIETGWGGASWFPFTFPAGPGPVPPDPDQGPIDAVTEAVWEWVGTHVPASAPLVPLGFSQGGLMALQLLRTRPERVAATVVLSGLVATAPQPADARLEALRPPVFWGRGDRDAVIWPEAVERLAAWLPVHSSLTARVYPGLGHGVSDAEMADVRAFLTGVAASPRG